MLPGFSPRPQHFVRGKKDTVENINSTNKALFVFVKDCENVEINVIGKVGKITLEDCVKLKVNISDHVVSGVSELIRCKDMEIRFGVDAQVPTLQVDDSCDVSIYIQTKAQIESIYFIRSKNLKLLLENQTVGEETGLALRYDVTSDEIDPNCQQIGHWNSKMPDANFVTEAYVREGLTSQTLKAKDDKPSV